MSKMFFGSHKCSEADEVERGERPINPDSGMNEEKAKLQSPTTTMATGETTLNTEEASQKWPIKFINWLWHHNSGFQYQSKVRKLNDLPGGYPRLACFLDSSEEFMIYRRFGFLQARILLHKQDELRKLERDLDNLDKYDDSRGEDGKMILRSRDSDDASGGPRKSLIKQIQVALKEYSELLIAARDIMALSKPTSRDYTSVKSYFDATAPVIGKECYIDWKEDVVTLKPGREHAWLDGMIEIVLKKFECRFLRWLFCSPESLEKSNGDKNVVLYTKERVGYVATVIIGFVILLLLIVPIYLLWHLSGEAQTGHNVALTVGVLLVFTLIFSFVLSFFTRARRHEILASAAAYCAVLVVFLSNVGPKSNGGFQ